MRWKEAECRGSQLPIDDHSNKQFPGHIVLVSSLISIDHPSLETDFCGQFARSKTAEGVGEG